MESNIAKKIGVLNYEQDKYPMLNKFMISLSDELITLEEVEQIVAFLATKGIIIQKPSQQNVLLNGTDFIQLQVGNMESIGCLAAYVEDPSRISIKGAYDRIKYLQNMGVSMVDEKGKFIKIPFSKKEFEKQYGLEYMNVAPVVESAPVISEPAVSSNPIEEVIAPVIEPVMEPVVQPWENTLPMVDAYAAIEPIVDVENEPIYMDPIEEILSKPQTIGLNDETFERYEKLAESVRHILVSVYGIEEINNSITDNLVKLVTNEIADDSLVLYKAITFGKNITDEEVKRLRSAISEELEYTNILELDMGMAV